MGKTDLIIFCGIPFAGKTTLAKELASSMGFERIDLDEIKFELLGNSITEEEIGQSNWDQIYQLMYQRIEEKLREGKTVIHDTGNFTKYERSLIQEIARRLNKDFVTVYIDTPYEVAKRRWQKNQETLQRFNITEDSFENAVKEMEIPDEEEHIISINTLMNFYAKTK